MKRKIWMFVIAAAATIGTLGFTSMTEARPHYGYRGSARANVYVSPRARVYTHYRSPYYNNYRYYNGYHNGYYNRGYYNHHRYYNYGRPGVSVQTPIGSFWVR